MNQNTDRERSIEELRNDVRDLIHSQEIESGSSEWHKLEGAEVALTYALDEGEAMRLWVTRLKDEHVE